MVPAISWMHWWSPVWFVVCYVFGLDEGTDSEGKHFLSNIWKYNCAFQMTSFGCYETTMSGFNPSFRIQGQVYHLIGTIVPTAGESPKFAEFKIRDRKYNGLFRLGCLMNFELLISLFYFLHRIAGKFGGENVWRIYSFQAFDGKKFGKWIDQPNVY